MSEKKPHYAPLRLLRLNAGKFTASLHEVTGRVMIYGKGEIRLPDAGSFVKNLGGMQIGTSRVSNERTAGSGRVMKKGPLMG